LKPWILSWEPAIFIITHLQFSEIRENDLGKEVSWNLLLCLTGLILISLSRWLTLWRMEIGKPIPIHMINDYKSWYCIKLMTFWDSHRTHTSFVSLCSQSHLNRWRVTDRNLLTFLHQAGSISYSSTFKVCRVIL